MDSGLSTACLQDLHPDEQGDSYRAYGTEYALENNPPWWMGVRLLRKSHADDRVKIIWKT